MSQQGKTLSLEQKQFIVNLKLSYDAEKSIGPTISTKDSVGRVSKGLGIGKRTVENILAQYKKDGQTLIETEPKSRGKPPFSLDSSLIPHIRHYVRSMNQTGQYLSVRRIRSWLIQEHKTNIPIMTLFRFLVRIGVVYGDGKRRSSLKESDKTIIARREYLRLKIKNRRKDGTKKRPEVYLDETYINQNISNDKTWYLETEDSWVNKPSGKGPRLIIVHAITEQGWVNDAKLVFQAKRKTGDYHDQMNWDNFSKWFIHQLLPNIPKNSLIVMDNASYHNVLVDDAFPTSSILKQELRDWLTAHHYDWTDDMLKAELFALCKEFAPTPQFKLDQIVKDYGHTILRTPPYHPELQPIETCWAVVKNHCRDNSDFTMKGLRKELAIGFNKVTNETCQKIISTVTEQEDIFWKEDAETD